MVIINQKKKAILAVTNDLTGDHRVHKTAMFLLKNNFDVLLVGRKKKTSQDIIETNYKTKRFVLPFEKGFLFYAVFNIRLFLFLLFKKKHIIVSNDLDTLPACYLAARLKKGGLNNLVYDSHEYFTEVPELVNRHLIKKIWTITERFLLPDIKHSMTVCQSISNIYKKKYGIEMHVVRNIPDKTNNNNEQVILPYKEHIIIYQGALNIGRGIELVVEAMQYIDNARFMIVGEGDITAQLKQIAIKHHVAQKIIFTGSVSHRRLLAYTKKAKVGISLEQNIGLNYYFALPNKLFDYIHAGIPVLASDLPEIRNIVEHYKIGLITDNFSPSNIAMLLTNMLTNSRLRKQWTQNLQFAKEKLSWQNEEKKLHKVFPV